MREIEIHPDTDPVRVDTNPETGQITVYDNEREVVLLLASDPGDEVLRECLLFAHREYTLGIEIGTLRARAEMRSDTEESS